MTPAVVSASCHPPKAGAVLGVTNGCLLPMAPWVALGPWLGFVRGPFRLRSCLTGLTSSISPRGPDGRSMADGSTHSPFSVKGETQ